MEVMEENKIIHQLTQTRNELNNIRKSVQSLKAMHRTEIQRLEEMLQSTKSFKKTQTSNEDACSTESSLHVDTDHTNSPVDNTNSDQNLLQMKPIGYFKSVHHQKNGTPRQGCLSNHSKGVLEICRDIFNNPSHSLDGLEDYSHVWLIYIFHKNSSSGTHAKVSPPRLDGQKVGVFSTRSPHRPNAIGLTLAKLDRVEGHCLHLSGIDILDGTPALDVKPYIPQYDAPVSHSEASKETSVLPINENVERYENQCERNVNEDYRNDDCTQTLPNVLSEKVKKLELSNINSINNLDENIVEEPIEETVSRTDAIEMSDSNCQNESNITIAKWVQNSPVQGLDVIFNSIAEKQMKQFSTDASDPNFRLEYLHDHSELRSAISSVLAEDPRSTYRRQKCSDRLYFFMMDTAHITTWFAEGTVEVLRVYPPNKIPSCFNLV